MLAINSKEYFLPFQCVDFDDNFCWGVIPKEHPDEGRLIHNFSFTIMVPGWPSVGTITFEYRDRSVKPSMRTLRILNATQCSAIVSVLSQNTVMDVESCIDDNNELVLYS